MLTPVRTAVAAAAVFAGLLAPVAAATADTLPLTPMAQSAEPVASGSSGTGSVNTGPTGTGSFDPSPTGSSNVIKSLQTGSGSCTKPSFPIVDGFPPPWCVLYN
ncbi:hypothetical protein D7D52_01345 [Nocardia yunnanensis]|uniref:Secreted protein n=1 Tax=Nocardia yunnanensis TaxID=2382165 RepID=A0A386Z680_9NOCA|nr:hypothetical protein [Nocardia yunnanensis]AYF72743.1 hypothetical protein D7D52_01345 [Nocardia yunnanensis]